MHLPAPIFFQDPPSEAATTTQETLAAPVAGNPQEQQTTADSGLNPMFFLVMGALFWFLILGPERKNRKKRQAMLDALSKGDEVMTTGGLFGRVSKVDEHEVILVVADGVRLRFSRAAVQGLRNEEDEQDEQDESKKS
ncbi:preprotein translocase subunit YajC [Candidatus Woesearchaeota archaeon]|jgi:preprotein translocase subunit YajC|nr:preprotein translocase subunit YajC [Candidatus Woesearchaeota archaeon]MDP6738785.1 preprotein translocase subunit YajC [Planctomycetota bacterium]MDP6938842.1 preprotein translocase subunit YajC [Planctomycetota bacterium]